MSTGTRTKLAQRYKRTIKWFINVPLWCNTDAPQPSMLSESLCLDAESVQALNVMVVSKHPQFHNKPRCTVYKALLSMVSCAGVSEWVVTAMWSEKESKLDDRWVAVWLDGLLLESILKCHQPTAFLSFSCCFNILSFSTSLFAFLFLHPLPPFPLHLFLPLLSCVNLLACPLALWPFFCALTYMSLLSSDLILQEYISITTIHTISSSTLSIQGSQSHTVCMSLSQAVNGEQNHHNWKRSLPGLEGAGEIVSRAVVLTRGALFINKH